MRKRAKEKDEAMLMNVAITVKLQKRLVVHILFLGLKLLVLLKKWVFSPILFKNH